MGKVLVVDDDPDMRAVMREALEGAGHEVFSASNGREAVHSALELQPDLIVLDIFMPRQDGLETIHQLRKQMPQLPILAISGRNRASSPMLTVALGMGAVNVLEKPFDALTLRAAAEATLETCTHCKPPEVLANQSIGQFLDEKSKSAKTLQDPISKYGKLQVRSNTTLRSLRSLLLKIRRQTGLRRLPRPE